MTFLYSLLVAFTLLATMAAVWFTYRAVRAGVERRRIEKFQQQIRGMQAVAGIRPGMKRRVRRERGRQFAKWLAHHARQRGLSEMSRPDQRRRQKSVARLVGRAAFA